MRDLVELELFIRDIEGDVSMCPQPVIEDAVREACIEACERAPIWRYMTQPIPVRTNQILVTLTPPAGESRVHSILSLKLDEHDIHNDARRAYDVPRRGEIQLHRAPGYAANLVAYVSVKPTREALEVSREIYDDHRHMIVAGATARLFSMRGQEWTDLAFAQGHATTFNHALHKARRNYDGGLVTDTNRVKPRRFAARSQPGGYRWRP